MAFSILSGLVCLTVMIVVSDAATSVYDFSVTDLNGNTVSMDKYDDTLLLIVNVASQCGYTSVNYRSLQSMYMKHRSFGLQIAAFPCNQFGAQEPWPEAEIDKWTQENFRRTFDLYSKVDVKGDDIHPLFKFLVESRVNNNAPIEWNFDGKFLVDYRGQVLQRWTNKTPLPDIDKYILGLKTEL
eukprot:143665_1